MRVEPYSVGSFLHIIKRGARGFDVVRDENDKWRFLRSLYFMNDDFFDKNWPLSTKGKGMFYRPEEWPKQKPLVSILGYTLMPNHFHLILQETQEGGVSLFMKKLGQSMSNYSNSKYEEQGSLFQGPYKSKTIITDTYFRYLAAYVLVKNTFELYPRGGIDAGQKNFEDVWKWAMEYPFSSLRNFMNEEISPILKQDHLHEIFSVSDFKTYAQDVVISGKWQQKKGLE